MRGVKSYVLLCCVLLLLSLPLTETVSAQPKPSTPEFAVKLLSDNNSVNKTIELTIKNQPAAAGYGFFYMVRSRVNDGNWNSLYTIDNVPGQSSGEYTVLSYPSDKPVVEYQYSLGDRIQNLFPGDKIDFQVQAMIGSIHRVYNPNSTSQLDMYPYVFTGTTSDWSNTQTLIMPVSSQSTPTPSVPELGVFSLLVAAVTLLTVAFLLRKNLSKMPPLN